jgi:hypothetical protein
MGEVRCARRFPSVEFRVYSLGCQKLLDSYEELSNVCDIVKLVCKFECELRGSYCGNRYDLGVEGLDNSLRKLINKYNSGIDVHEKLTSVHEAIRTDADDWDARSPLIEFRDIGKGLAQDFYREGGRAPNIELINSETPALVFSNQCLSERTPSEFKEGRPISTLCGDIHLPFTEEFGFGHYLSYPFLFFHEYASHIYVPRIDSLPFVDGWLMYAIDQFRRMRWAELCERYRLICAQGNALSIWRGRFTRLAKRGYEIAEDFDLWVDNDRFLQFTWDLASYPFDVAGHFDFHKEFLKQIQLFTQSDRGHLLLAAVANSADALQLYENLIDR